MPKCPVCETPYIDNQVVSCGTCAWDLIQYPLTLAGVCSDKQAKLTWAKQVWKNLLGKSKQSAISLPISNIVSTSGEDYTLLWELLTAGKWESANHMTKVLTLRLAGREKEGEDYFDQRASENFPGSDLGIIDRLWTQYSDGHFGFSVQKRISLQIIKAQPGSPHNVIDSIVRANGNTHYFQQESRPFFQWDREFTKQVGWEAELIYNLKQPEGHLPCIKRKLIYAQNLMPKAAIIEARKIERIAGLYTLLMRKEL